MSETQETLPSSEAAPVIPPVEEVKKATDTQTTEEGDKTTEEVAAKEVEDKTDADKTAKQVPLTADDFTLPDGVETNDELQTEFLEIMNKDQEPKDRLQALVDLQVKANQVAQEAASKLWQDLQDKWTEEVKADPDIGGSKLEATQSVIAKSLEEFGNKDVREAFVLTGAGNNPHIVRYVHKMAVALSEGKPVVGTPATAEATQAEKLYPQQGK